MHPQIAQIRTQIYYIEIHFKNTQMFNENINEKIIIRQQKVFFVL